MVGMPHRLRRLCPGPVVVMAIIFHRGASGMAPSRWRSFSFALLSVSLLGAVLQLSLPTGRPDSVRGSSGDALFPRDHVKDAEEVYRRKFPDPSSNESPVDPLPREAYRDEHVCAIRTVAEALFSSRLAPWSVLRCAPAALQNGLVLESHADGGRAAAVLKGFGVGVDRWTHPSLVRAIKGQQDNNADTATLADETAVAVGRTARAPGQALTYFTQRPFETKVLRHVLYFRRVSRNPGAAQEADAPVGDTTPANSSSSSTDTASVIEQSPGDPMLQPNDVVERFVVASATAYNQDRALYRRLTEFEALRAIRFAAAQKAARLKERKAGRVPDSADNEAEIDEAEAHSKLEWASKDHVALVESTFTGHRATLGFFASAASLAARPPDVMTLGDGYGQGDVNTVDVTRYLLLASKTTGLPPQLQVKRSAVDDDGRSIAADPHQDHPVNRSVPAAVAFVINLRTCLANHWHGTVEVVLPLFSLLSRHKIITDDIADGKAPLPLIFIRAPPRAVWGSYNRGCPSLNRFPYGSSTAGAWLFRLIAPNAIFFDERGEHRRNMEASIVQNISVALHIERLVVSGLDYTCGGSFDMLSFFTFETLWSPRRTPPRVAYPFLLTKPHMCDRFISTFRRFVLRRLRIDDPGWWSPEETRCPRVVVLDRQDARNGRRIRNGDVLLASLRRVVMQNRQQNHCRSGVEANEVVRVVKLHRHTPYQQLELIQKATMVLAVRGAATIAMAFARPGSALVTLAPVHYSVPFSYTSDNTPWWPFYTLRKDVAIGLGVCRAVPLTDANSSSPFTKMCRVRSVNFCDMMCDESEVVWLVKAVLQAQEELVFEAALLRRHWLQTAGRVLERQSPVNVSELSGEDSDVMGRIDRLAREARIAAVASVVDGHVRVLPLSSAVAAMRRQRPLWAASSHHDMAGAQHHLIRPVHGSVAPDTNSYVNVSIDDELERRSGSSTARAVQRHPRHLVTVIVPDVTRSPSSAHDTRLFFMKASIEANYEGEP